MKQLNLNDFNSMMKSMIGFIPDDDRRQNFVEQLIGFLRKMQSENKMGVKILLDYTTSYNSPITLYYDVAPLIEDPNLEFNFK